MTWKAYEEFGRWYKVPDEISDVVWFLKEKAGVPVWGDSQISPLEDM